MSEMKTAAGRRWHLGSMNDALFIVDAPPRPSTDDVYHDRKDGPLVVMNVNGLSVAAAQAICDAHNAAIEAKSERLRKALEPFVSAFNKAHSTYAARYCDHVEIGFARFDTMPDSWAMDNITFSMGDFRAARAALEATP